MKVINRKSSNPIFTRIPTVFFGCPKKYYTEEVWEFDTGFSGSPWRIKNDMALNHCVLIYLFILTFLYTKIEIYSQVGKKINID